MLLIKNVHLALARGEATTVVMLGQSTAFHMIDHGTLLDCLSSWFDHGGVVLDWFKSYLSDCLQCGKIGSFLSDDRKRSFCLACLRAPSLVQYSFPYILLPSATSFVITPA